MLVKVLFVQVPGMAGCDRGKPNQNKGLGVPQDPRNTYREGIMVIIRQLRWQEVAWGLGFVRRLMKT